MRNNNFDILRLICALLVVVSHSYALLGLGDSEPLLYLTQSMAFSAIGLCGFFTISGYLILNSLVTSKNVFSYLVKRFLRIFPGLLACLLLVAIACSFFYSGDNNYWAQKETYSFVWNNLGLYTIQWGIPGVFENNPMSTVNGSLWTLAHEFTLYLLIIGLFFVRKHKSVITGLTITALILCMTKNVYFADKFAHTEVLCLGVNSFSRFAQFFLVGMLLQNRKCFKTDKARLIICVISGFLAIGILIVHSCIHTSVNLSPFVMLCASLIFIMLGEMYWKSVSDGLKQIGDLSYGTYIYAFPIQQMLIALLPNITPIGLMILTIVSVLPVAFASWHIVEKRALGLKRYL